MKAFNFVYKTENLLNGKIYVGKKSSDTLDDGYLGSGRLLKLAIKKYGRENFRREIIRFCPSEQEAYLLEGLIVDQDFVAREDTYNLKCGGEGGLRGFHHSEESKRKSRESNSGLKRSDEARKNISEGHIGIKMPPASEERGRKISQRLTGRRLSEEHCKNISEGKRNISDETRQKLRESHQGHMVTCPHCRRKSHKDLHFKNCLKSK